MSRAINDEAACAKAALAPANVRNTTEVLPTVGPGKRHISASDASIAAAAIRESSRELDSFRRDLQAELRARNEQIALLDRQLETLAALLRSTRVPHRNRFDSLDWPVLEWELGKRRLTG